MRFPEILAFVIMRIFWIVIQVLLDLQLNIDAADIKWEVTPVPLVFGEDVKIQCSYPNILSCSDKVVWTWTSGTENELLMYNGTLTKKYKKDNKHSEKTSSCSQYSTLIISLFNESDYTQVYTCSIAYIDNVNHSNVEYLKDKINFKNTSYEYIPDEKTIFTDIQIKHQEISCKVEIVKIYPLPECTATFANKDITNTFEVQKQKSGLFYNVAYNTTIYDKSLDSMKDLCIICNGTRKKWYLTKNLNPYCIDIKVTARSGFYVAAMVPMDLFGAYYAVFVLIEMMKLNCCHRDKFKFKDKMKTFANIDSISHMCLGFCSAIAFFGIVQEDIIDESRKPSDLEYFIGVISIIAIALLVISSSAILIVTIIVQRKTWKGNDLITKTRKLCYTTGLCLFAVVILICFVYYCSAWKKKYIMETNTNNGIKVPYLVVAALIFLLTNICSKMMCVNVLTDQQTQQHKEYRDGVPCINKAVLQYSDEDQSQNLNVTKLETAQYSDEDQSQKPNVAKLENSQYRDGSRSKKREEIKLVVSQIKGDSSGTPSTFIPIGEKSRIKEKRDKRGTSRKKRKNEDITCLINSNSELNREEEVKNPNYEHDFDLMKDPKEYPEWFISSE